MTAGQNARRRRLIRFRDDEDHKQRRADWGHEYRKNHPDKMKLEAIKNKEVKLKRKKVFEEFGGQIGEFIGK